MGFAVASAEVAACQKYGDDGIASLFWGVFQLDEGRRAQMLDLPGEPRQQVGANAPRSTAAALIAIITGVVWFGACVNDRRAEPTANADDSGSPFAERSAVEAYLEFAAMAGDSAAPLSDDQMAEGLRKLAGALGSVNAGGPDLMIDLRTGAEQVLLNPAAPETAAIIREAMAAAADALEKGSGPNPALQEAVQSVTPDRPLAEQRVAVLDFFRQAADAIRRKTATS